MDLRVLVQRELFGKGKRINPCRSTRNYAYLVVQHGHSISGVFSNKLDSIDFAKYNSGSVIHQWEAVHNVFIKSFVVEFDVNWRRSSERIVNDKRTIHSLFLVVYNSLAIGVFTSRFRAVEFAKHNYGSSVEQWDGANNQFVSMIEFERDWL